MLDARKIIVKMAFGMVCLSLSVVAHAGTVVLTLDGNFAPPDYAFYSYTDTSNAVENSIPVGPYITYLNGGGFNNTLAYTFCYDFNSPTSIGTPYSGSLVLGTDPNAPDYIANLEATFLVNQLNAFGMFNAPMATRGALSMAIWEIMNPSSNTSSSQFPTDPAALPYETEAVTAVGNGSWTAADAALYPMWVPDNPSVQRFGVVFGNQAPVPEPTNLALMGLGVLGLAILGRRAGVGTQKSAGSKI